MLEMIIGKARYGVMLPGEFFGLWRERDTGAYNYPILVLTYDLKEIHKIN